MVYVSNVYFVNNFIQHVYYINYDNIYLLLQKIIDCEWTFKTSCAFTQKIKEKYTIQSVYQLSRRSLSIMETFCFSLSLFFTFCLFYEIFKAAVQWENFYHFATFVFIRSFSLFHLPLFPLFLLSVAFLAYARLKPILFFINI